MPASTAVLAVLAVLLLLTLPTTGLAQKVHPAGASLTAVNWQPASNLDSVRVDVDGDNVADVAFREVNFLPSGAGQPTRLFFTAAPRSAGTELALDSVEFDSAHRFLANETIGRGLRWSSTGAYLAYTLIGNGGTGGRGFFRNGTTGYVVIRKRVANSWSYWWFNITGSTNATRSQVSFYGRSGSILTVSSAGTVPAAGRVFPNPTTISWQLAGNGSFQLFDSQGKLLQYGTVSTVTTVGTSALATGIYFLQFQASNGTISHQKLVRE